MDSRLTLSKLWMVLISIVALVLLSSCEQDPTAPVGGGDKLTLDPGTESGTQASWRMLNVVQTQEQFSAIVAGGEGFISDEMGMVNNIADVRRETDRARGVFSRAARSQSFSKVATDSLIWSEEWNDPISGTAGRRALY